MAVNLGQVIGFAETLWPLSGAEEWDRPGLVCGSPNQPVARILLTVDVTHDVLTEAVDGGFDLILAHHPYLLRGVSTISEQTSKGALLSEAIRRGVAIYAAHTNADIVSGGVSDALAEALGIIDARPLVPSALDTTCGHGRIGILPSPITLLDFARKIAATLPATASGVRVAGPHDKLVSTVALCGGAGDSFIAAAQKQKADVYLTSDLRHHPAQDAVELRKIEESAPCLVDLSHWAAEWLWLDRAAAQLNQEFEGLQVVVSQIRTDPWDFVVTQ